jgi:hypothetical protein
MKIVLIALSVISLWGQENKLSVSDPSWNGIEVRFLTKMEPAGGTEGPLPGAVVIEHGRVHHLIDDANHKRTFGYDLSVVPESDGKTVQLKITPMRFADGKPYSVQPGWILMELPKYPVIPKIKVGETVALDLLVNPATGQKMVDYLTVAKSAQQPEGAAQDFTLPEVELSLMDPRVQMNGKALASTTGGTSGQVIWLYLPGHGRFTISLFPNEKRGFARNGTVSGATFSFRDGADEYRVACSGSVAPGSGRYNLYVRHEPRWYPGAQETFLIGSNDRNSELTIK